MLYSRSLRRSALAAGAVLALAWSSPAFAADGVSPSTVSQNLEPGHSVTLTKTVTTPSIVPKPDIYFLADTTGSMGGVLANVQGNAASIIDTVDAAASDPRYGAGDYKDFPGAYAFQNDASIPAADDNGVAAKAAIAGWSAGGGNDGPEGSMFALHKLLGSAGFRAAATKIVVWFGDAPGHDPVCSAISGEPTVTEASMTAELVAAGVKVIAVSTTTGHAAGLDDDPTSGSTDYGVCGAPGGTAGQASRIAAATGGTTFKDVPPADVSNAILAGLTALPVTVKPVATCDPDLSATFSPADATVISGATATFTETLTLSASATAGTKVCTVDFQLNGSPAGPAFVETNTITAIVNHPPDCSKVKVTPGSLWPPNHKLQTVTAAGLTDADGDATTLTVTGVTQDEAINGLGDGDTGPDAAWVTGHANQVQLRAERSGTGDGRVYRVWFAGSDGKAGCTGKALVGVPHDQSGPAAVDTVAVVVNSFGP